MSVSGSYPGFGDPNQGRIVEKAYPGSESRVKQKRNQGTKVPYPGLGRQNQGTEVFVPWFGRAKPGYSGFRTLVWEGKTRVRRFCTLVWEDSVPWFGGGRTLESGGSASLINLAVQFVSGRRSDS